MRCAACRSDVSPTSRYCENCGARQPARCPVCGTGHAAGARFCGFCGAPLQQARGGAEAAGWGELKHATVLFADIVSSTELVAALDPEAAMQRLQPALDAMCMAVKRFDGTVVRTMGDGILALFGAPQAREGHALLACEAALAIQEQMSGSTDGLVVRIGLNSGEIVSDPPPDDPARERGAHGLALHLASRVTALGEPGEICITADCHRLVRAYCEAQPRGRHHVKGIAEPVEIFRLVGLKPAVASQSFRGKALATFRGRDQELGILRLALRGAEKGETAVVGIAGAPGSGKSRLCYEFARECHARLIPVFEARAQLYGHATPLKPVLEFLRSHFFRILPGDDASVARASIARQLAEIGPTFEADLPLVCEFLGVSEPNGAPSHLAPRARHARLLDIVRHMVRHGGTSPSVILVEDLHWLDEASEDFIGTVVDAVAGTRTLLVVNYRPSYVAPWMQLPYYREVMLADLAPAQTDELVMELVGTQPDLADLRARIARRCGGNPFFAEELVRALVASGVLVGEPGRFTSITDAAPAPLPATVQAVIGDRIDRLPDAQKSVLQTCAVIGKEIPAEILERVTDTPAPDLADALDRLCRAELLQVESGAEGPRFAFPHPLIQEVAYGTQLKARRSALHAAVARAMELCYAQSLDEHAALLAWHYEASGQRRDAARCAALAARWVGSTDSAQAIKHWRKVRELLDGQPASRQNTPLRIMANGQIAWLGWREGLTAEEARPFIDEALAYARGIDDGMIALLLAVDGRITVASGGSADVYVERVREALSLLQPERDRGRAATLHASLSHAYGWAGLLREALAAADAAMANVEHIGPFDPEFLGYSVEHWIVSLRGRILARTGRHEEARACFERMLGIGSAGVDPTIQIISHHGFVDTAWALGDAALAMNHAAQLRGIAARHGNPYLRAIAYSGTGIALAIAGEPAEAAREFGAGIDFIRATRAGMENETEMLASLADCVERCGEAERAIHLAREAIELSRRRAARLPECRAHVTLAAALLAARGREAQPEARTALARAAELIDSTGAAVYGRLLAEDRVAAAGGAGAPGADEQRELAQPVAVRDFDG